MTSILNSIKKLLGISADDINFDTDIIIYINTALTVLTSLGIGPAEGFHITGATQVWSSFLGDNTNLTSVQTYIYLKVKLIFDPPTSGVALSAFDNAAKELEWRLTVQAESNAIAAAEAEAVV